ncbi:hypothetical protein DVH24_041934 [Malus domestica]|uniref:Uncharacterized protein n=1 Tax=Malus domestica TaxID=3750 RepID=A0A498IP84_MALDO|nr:hypothetical protein DVH24_041934 [Malus domestica]
MAYATSAIFKLYLLEIVEVLLPSRDSVGGEEPPTSDIFIIKDCEKLEALPEDMHNLNSLKQLIIDYREGLTFPPNLASLIIWKVKSCKSLWELSGVAQTHLS